MCSLRAALPRLGIVFAGGATGASVPGRTCVAQALQMQAMCLVFAARECEFVGHVEQVVTYLEFPEF